MLCAISYGYSYASAVCCHFHLAYVVLTKVTAYVSSRLRFKKFKKQGESTLVLYHASVTDSTALNSGFVFVRFHKRTAMRLLAFIDMTYMGTLMRQH